MRRAVQLALLTASLTALALSPVTGADALQADKVTYDPTSGEPMDVHIDSTMAATDGGEINTPDECALVPSCTMVPLEITPLLDRGEDEDWIVQLDVNWQAEDIETPNNLAGSQKSGDLDIYLYHVGPLYDDEGNPEKNADGTQAEGYVETGRSASGGAPETLKLFRPVEKDYYLVVINFLGVTNGFDLHFSFTDTSFGGLGSFVDNDTDVAPAVVDNDDRASLGDSPATPSFSAPAAPSAMPASTPVSFTDDDFGFAFDVPDDLLEGNEGPIRGSLFEEEELAPPKDVAGGTLILWLGLLPLAILVAAAIFFVKRRPSTLSLKFPVRRAVAEPVTE